GGQDLAVGRADESVVQAAGRNCDGRLRLCHGRKGEPPEQDAQDDAFHGVPPQRGVSPPPKGADGPTRWNRPSASALHACKRFQGASASPSATQASANPVVPAPSRKPQWPPLAAISSRAWGGRRSAWKCATGITGSSAAIRIRAGTCSAARRSPAIE